MSSLTGKPLDGQVVAILGGAGSMGHATAMEVSRLGGHPLLIGRTLGSLSETARLLPGDATSLVVDVTRGEELKKALLGEERLDHLVVAISAKAAASSIATTDAATARQAFSRFWVCYDVLQMAPSLLSAKGSVTLVSGSSARTPAPGYGVWTALHGSIEALARAAAIDIAPIRVNVVSPGGIGLEPDRQLVQRRGQPSDIGVAIAGLILNPAITGAVLDVDSGERKGTWSG